MLYRRIFLTFLLFAAPGATFAAESSPSAADLGVTAETPGNPLVLMETSMGDIVLELFPNEAPQTVASFIGLAEGTKPFTDPETGQQVTRPFFDGLTFHRVIDDFMIQSGSPTGDGQGDPGFVVRDEINARSLGLDKIPALDENGVPHPYLGVRDERGFRDTVLMPLYGEMGITSNEELEQRVDEVYEVINGLSVMDVNENLGYRYNENHPSRMPVAGVIAMANAGPDSAGSQFFINLVDTPWLTGKYTIFGKVRSGMEVAERIGQVTTDMQNRPLQDVVINAVHVLEDSQ